MPNRLGEHLLPEIDRWLEQRLGFDLEVRAGRDPRPIKCHKVVLAAVSPLLRSLLLVNDDPEMATLVFDGVSRPQLVQLVLFFYNKKPIVSKNREFFENLMQILEISNYTVKNDNFTVNNYEFKCQVCDLKKFDLKDDLKNHLNGHKEDLIVHNIRLIKLSKEAVDADELNCPACLRKFQRLNQIQGHFRECTIRIIKELDNLVSVIHIQDEDPRKLEDIDGEKILGDFVNALKIKKGSSSVKRVQPRTSLSCSKCKASFATKESRTLHNCDSKFDQYTDFGGVRQARCQPKSFTESHLQEKKLRRNTHENTSTTTREDESRSTQPPNAFSSESSDDERGVEDLQIFLKNFQRPKLVRKRCHSKAAEGDSKRSKTEDKNQSNVENSFSSESSDGGESTETEESAANNATPNEILGAEGVSSLAPSEDALPRLPEKTNFSSESSDGDASTDTEECSVNDKKVRKFLEDSESDQNPKASDGGEMCFICGKIFKDIKSHRDKVHTRPRF